MKRTKEEQEWISLHQVFSKRDYPCVTKSEKPDFIIRDGNVTFGVEVTNYYQDQSSANYDTVPEYMDNILINDPKTMNKVGGRFSRVQVGIDIDGRHEIFANMVYKPFLSPQDRLIELNDTIDKKVNKFSQYRKDLAFIDLIIHDQGDLFGGESGRKIYAHLLELSKTLSTNLPYRKIYIIKKINIPSELIVFTSKL